MNQEIIYSLNTEDIQTVANEVLNRPLNEKEIELIKCRVEKKIDWHDIVEMSIIEEIRDNVE